MIQKSQRHSKDLLLCLFDKLIDIFKRGNKMKNIKIAHLLLTMLCSSFVFSSNRHDIYEYEFDRYLTSLEGRELSNTLPSEVREELSLFTSPVTPTTSPLRRTDSIRSFDGILREARAGEVILRAALALQSVEHVYAYVVVMDHLRGNPTDRNLLDYPSVRQILIGHNVLNVSGLFVNNILGNLPPNH